MGCTASTAHPQQQIPWWSHKYDPIYGAGCMFINDTHTLAGIHTPRRNHEVRICGFGGKAEGEEPWWLTAFRETIEEFFHISSIPYNLYHALKQIQPIRILQQEEPRYITLVYTFEQLKSFLKICASYISTSPLYAKMPRTADDLVFKRCVGSTGNVEIMDIVYWPLKNPHRRFRISRDFMWDMRSIRQTLQQLQPANVNPPPPSARA